MERKSINLQAETVEGFGREWQRFDQSHLESQEHQKLFDSYFRIFPWSALPPNAVGADLGCGSGRWAMKVAPRVGHLHAVDASSEALRVARGNLASFGNCEFHKTSVDRLPFADESLDFAYSLGVLHHIPDPQAGLRACVRKLKPGAPFLLYIYYRFDDRPFWFRALWRVSDLLRRVLSRCPFFLRARAADFLATFVYWPLSRMAAALERLGKMPRHFPLAYYRNVSFYSLRTDALDRFGTRLEWRMTKPEIQRLMEDCGLTAIRFSDSAPYWCAVGIRK